MLLLLLAARALVLESLELTDPTETRYASIGQHMLESGNWLTPQLPTPQGWEPYLGKPPLHFWMTALSLKFFGIDEWSSRLPSFLMGLLILFCVFNLGQRFFGERAAFLGTLITLSSPLFFMLAGASTTDMTLSAFVVLALWALIPGLVNGEKLSTFETFIAAAAAGAGFLTKGPVAIVLIGLPIILWCALRKDFSFFKRFPWIAALIIFLIVVTPWFYLSEKANPGFMKYFFWNENIQRYLVKDYGDRYGTGHRYPRGMAWVMVAVGFVPWTLLLPFLLRRLKEQSFTGFFRNQPALLGVLLAGLSPAIFFTLVKQLQPGYLMPAIPWLGLSVAALFVQFERESLPAPSKFFNVFLWAAPIVGLGTLAAGIYFGLSIVSLGVGLLVLLIIVLLSRADQISDTLSTRSMRVAIQTCCLLFIAMFAAVPYVDTYKSTKGALLQLIAHTDQHNPVVGVVSLHTYSHYWLAAAWQNELGEQATIKYFSPEEILKGTPAYLLLKERDHLFSDPKLLSLYNLKGTYGRWSWLERKTTTS